VTEHGVAPTTNLEIGLGEAREIGIAQRRRPELGIGTGEEAESQT